MKLCREIHTMTAHDHDQQSELREFIINMYSISTDLFCPISLNNGCMDGETLEEKTEKRWYPERTFKHLQCQSR